MFRYSYYNFLLFAGLLWLSACHPDPAPQNQNVTYQVPTTYNAFGNVDHTESTTILGMMSELSTEIAKGTGIAGATLPVALSQDHLIHLFENTGSEFAVNPGYNTSGFSISNESMPGAQTLLENFLDTLAAVSQTGTAAKSGVAGLGLSNDATPRRFLLTATGENYAQVFNKTLMGALITYQITSRVSNTALDNAAEISGPGGVKYTALEHNWDEAFGFWSVPDSFPLTKTPVKYWGSYSNQVDSGLHCNSRVMNAFLKGRAAISNKDIPTARAMADSIVHLFDLMTAGAVCQELNEVQAAVTAKDLVKVVSALSEAKGFVIAMQFNKNPGRVITDDEINALLGYFPQNFWDVAQGDLDKIRAYINKIYGFSQAQSLIL